MIHCFENAGLGQAPFKYTGYTRELPTSCQYCGTNISWRFHLTSADGHQFYVGCECIKKSGDAGLREAIRHDVAKIQKESHTERETAIIATWEKYFAENPNFWQNISVFCGPHPYDYYSRLGKNNWDYQIWKYQRAAFAQKAKLAKYFLKMADRPLPLKHNTKAYRSIMMVLAG